MNEAQIPSPRPTVVILGGGIAGLEAALALHDLAPDRADVTLIAPDADFVYKPMTVEEPFSRNPAQRLELAPLLDELGMSYMAGAVTAVDADAHAVQLSDGSRVPYRMLLVAVGGRARPAYSGTETFCASQSEMPIEELIDRAREHPSRTLAFVAPPGTTWPLPLYELAMMTRRRAEESGMYGLGIQLLTPESAPLAIFGAAASDAVGSLLKGRAIELLSETYVTQATDGTLLLRPGEERLVAGAVMALPTIEGPAVEGLPMDDHGFVPIDEHARVPGVPDVYAAGDGTTFPIKQGGLATQQADAAAEHIAARLGTGVEAHEFHPVLRGQLLIGGESINLRHDVTGGHGEGTASLDYLWWPPQKVGGRYLAAWLAHTTPHEDLEPPYRPLDVEVSLSREWHTDPMAAGSMPAG